MDKKADSSKEQIKRGLEALLAPCDHITSSNTANRDGPSAAEQEGGNPLPEVGKEPETIALNQDVPLVARGRSYA